MTKSQGKFTYWLNLQEGKGSCRKTTNMREEKLSREDWRWPLLPEAVDKWKIQEADKKLFFNINFQYLQHPCIKLLLRR